MEFVKEEKLTTFKNYDCNIENVLEQIEKFGVAVIPNILNKDEINNMRKGLWDTIEYLSCNLQQPIDRYDIKTWENWYQLLPNHYMLMQTYSIGHSQFIWDVRQNPKVVDVFSKIWSCQPEELITSYDAVSFHLPPEITGEGWYDNDDWFHVDASFMRKEFECVQGFVTGYDINEGDASLTILEGSNKYHSEYGDYFEDSENDWVRLNDDDLNYYDKKGCKRHNIMAKAGSLILWDSRTVHCGMKPLENRANPNFRLVTYVCMTPREWMSEKVIEFRRSALEELYMTTHCPHRPKLFPKRPNSYGGRRLIPQVPEIPPPNLTDLGRKLCGF